MKTETKIVTIRTGENIGPIDWSYDFTSHAWSQTRGGYNPELIPERIDSLKQIDQAFRDNRKVQAYIYGQWVDVLDVGMYDGWPYWKPVPSIQIMTPYGPEWHDFMSIQGAKSK